MLWLACCAAIGFTNGGGNTSKPSNLALPAASAADLLPAVKLTAKTPEAKPAPLERAPDAAEKTADTAGSAAEPESAMIAFTFDDGCFSDYELAYPILKEYGIRGTSYIAPGYQDEGKPFVMEWDQIREMAAYGWVLGCHTYAHSDLTTMTQGEIAQSMEMVDEAFLREGLCVPAVHAYPYGRYDENVIGAIIPYRAQARKAFYETNFVDLDAVDPYEIDCISADMRTEERLREKEALVDKACEEDAAIVFRCHCLYRNEVDDMGEWVVQTDSALFKKLVAYCAEKGCRFVTMAKLIGMYDG